MVETFLRVSAALSGIEMMASPPHRSSRCHRPPKLSRGSTVPFTVTASVGHDWGQQRAAAAVRSPASSRRRGKSSGRSSRRVGLTRVLTVLAHETRRRLVRGPDRLPAGARNVFALGQLANLCARSVCLSGRGAEWPGPSVRTAASRSSRTGTAPSRRVPRRRASPGRPSALRSRRNGT